MVTDNPTPARKLTVVRDQVMGDADVEDGDTGQWVASFAHLPDADQFAASDTILREHGAMRMAMSELIEVADAMGWATNSGMADAAIARARTTLASLSPAPTTPPKAGENMETE